MAKKRKITENQVRSAVVCFVLAGFGAGAVILYSVESFPLGQVAAGAAFAPIAPLLRTLASTWAPLPGLLSALVALVFAPLAVGLLRGGGPVRGAVAVVALTATLFFGSAAYQFLAEGVGSAEAGVSVAAAIARTFFLLPALLMYALWLVVGWVVYLVPIAVGAMGGVAFISWAPRRRRVSGQVLWSLGEATLIAISVFLIADNTTPIAAKYVVAAIGRSAGMAVVVSATVVSGFFLVLSLFRVRVRELFAGGKGRRKKSGGKAEPGARPKSIAGDRPSAESGGRSRGDGRRVAETQRRRSVADEAVAPKGAPAPQAGGAVALNLKPLPPDRAPALAGPETTPQRADATGAGPAADEPGPAEAESASGETGAARTGPTDEAPNGTRGEGQEGAEGSADPNGAEVDPDGGAAARRTDTLSAEEVDARRAEVERALKTIDLTLRYSSIAVGPTLALLRYDIPAAVTVKSLEKRVSELESEIGASCLSVLCPLSSGRQVGFLFRRDEPRTLGFDEIHPAIDSSDAALPLYVGRTVEGADHVADLARLPHLLVAGTTGSGKSVFLHSIIRSLTESPKGRLIRLVLADPKRVEFGAYSSSANLACPILDENEAIMTVLDQLTDEMEGRYRVLAAEGVRSIDELHEVHDDHEMAYVVVIIDEVSDLLFSDEGKEIKRSIIRLAQKSRAVGIHLVLATQRPSADVIDGLIKANFPGRVAFRTASRVDSRVILDVGGAERLAGKGDGLFLSPEQEAPLRFQGAFVLTE